MQPIQPSVNCGCPSCTYDRSQEKAFEALIEGLKEKRQIELKRIREGR